MILITGFEPFDGHAHNPSAAVLDALPSVIGGHAVRRLHLPVDTERAPERLSAALSEDPDAVLCLGLAADRSVVSVERIALNLRHFDRPDNAGRRPRATPVVEGAPLALASRAPIDAILARWEALGLPVGDSAHAGTYLCNQVLYLALHRTREGVPVTFVRLPPDERLAADPPRPHLPLARLTEATIAAAELRFGAARRA